jgi:hypothetical protein
MPVPPRNIHLHCHTIDRLLHLPLRVSATGRIMNSQSSVVGAGISLGENHFQANSLTWREFPRCPTTCLFNHNHLPHLERVLHTGLTTFFFNSILTQGGQQQGSTRNIQWEQATLSQGTTWPQQPTVMTHTT